MSAGALDVALAMARRSWAKLLARPVTLTFSLGQPLLWMLFFGFLFSRFPLDLAGQIRYFDFLAPGASAMSVLFGASQAGVTWIRDLQTGFLPRLLRTPASPHALLLGKLAADVVRLLVQAAVVLLLAALLGARLHPAPGPVLAATAALALFAFAFASLSSAIAFRARAPEPMATFVHLVNMPLLFTSTALVPAKQMPAWLAEAARLNPLTLAVDAWRGAWLEGAAPAWGTTFGALVGLGVLLYGAAVVLMRGLGRG